MQTTELWPGALYDKGGTSPTGNVPEWTREIPGEVPAATRLGKVG